MIIIVSSIWLIYIEFFLLMVYVAIGCLLKYVQVFNLEINTSITNSCHVSLQFFLRDRIDTGCSRWVLEHCNPKFSSNSSRCYILESRFYYWFWSKAFVNLLILYLGLALSVLKTFFLTRSYLFLQFVDFKHYFPLFRFLYLSDFQNIE